MLKNNNVNSNGSEESKKVIRVSDYYPNNCSEQDYVEVSQEILDAYAEFEEIDDKIGNWDHNHRVNVYFNEEYFGHTWDVCVESPEESVIGKDSVESLVFMCGEIAYRRSIKYFFYKKTLSEIAKEENVSVGAIYKSVKSFERMLLNLHKIKRE